MQVLLIFTREDPHVVTLRNAIYKCGYNVKCCKNIEETHEAFKKINYDLVFIDCRRNQSVSLPNFKSTSINTTQSSSNTSNPYDYINICRFIRKLFQYTVIVGLTSNYEDRDIPSVLPLLKAGFNKTITETTNLNRCINELLTLEYGEVSNVRRLQAAHALFTALEYTNDPIEIMNDQFKLLYVNNSFEKVTGYTLNELSGQDFKKLHSIDPSDTFIRQLSQGNACECNLELKNINGEISNHTSITIPVIFQGETNKIQNYVTITNLMSEKHFNTFKLKKSISNNNEKSLEENFSPEQQQQQATKKLSSFNLPSKRSYDFNKFAYNSVFANQENTIKDQTKETMKKTTSYSSSTPTNTNPHPSLSSTVNIPSYSNSITDDNTSLAYTDDEKLLSSNQLILLDNQMELARSFPEFQDSNPLINKNFAQRKRSYEVQSINTNEGRRHSMARFNSQNVEAPIRRVINILCLAHEKSNTDIVRLNLDKALDILRTTELYNPSLVENDKHTSDLVSGLMSNGLERRVSTNILGTKRQHFTKNLSPDVNKLLETSESWSFDIIALERLTSKRPLVTLGLNIMNRFDVCEYLKIDEIVLVNWLTLMESNYLSSNPYHNSTHASDVLHATAYFLSTDKISDVLDSSDKVASLIAAAVHDLNHPGRTNAFLCNSNNDLAILYNDQAVLENHHAALAFQLTRQNESANIFKNLTRDEFRTLRSIIIDMVLATEMNKHFEHLNKFVNKFCVSDDEKTPSKNVEFLKSPENKLLIKRILIKCADVSNPCRPLDIYKEWANRIASEYFEQTDDEKQKGLPVVMPTFDRLSCNIPKAQISFIEYFITEMFETWDDFIDIPEIISNLQANTLYWRECSEAQINQLNILQSQEKIINHNKSIKEDCENESELENTDE